MFPPSCSTSLVRDLQTLELPSPTYVKLMPSIRPFLSITVRQSAIAWQGCNVSLRAFITGLPALRDGLEVAVLEDARHDAIHEAVERPAGVGDGLAATELKLVPSEVDWMPPQLVDPDVEGYARPRRWLLEQEGYALALEARGESFPVPSF